MKNPKIRRSKNPLANWIFNSLLTILKKVERKKRLVGNLVKLYKVCDLRNFGNKKKEELSGLIVPRKKNTYCIYINSKKSPSEQIKTIIHEIGHFIFWWEYEPKILKWENLVWSALSLEQKAILFDFVRKAKIIRQPKK